MAIKTIAELWDDFAAKAVPLECPEELRVELHMVFYAGVAAVLGILTDVARELDDFAVTIRKDQA